MKKRQELATQMQIEAVKDVREQISGYERKKNLMFYNIKHTGITDFSIELYFTPKPKINDAHRSEMILMNSTYLKIYYDFKYGYIVIEDSFGGWQNVKIPIDFGVKTHIVYTRKGLMYTGYKNGEYVTSLTKKENCIDFAGFELKSTVGTYYTNEEYYNIRIFNYALSADEVTALYNNGKPEEYMLPSISKNGGLYYNLPYEGSWLFKNHIANTQYIIHTDGIAPIFTQLGDGKSLVLFKITGLTGSGAGLAIGAGSMIPDIFEDGIYYRRPNTTTFGFKLYGIGIFVNLTVELLPINCIAEYLPQNLISTNDGVMNSTTATKWLDSAKQLPLNDEYLEPLLESIGGYDLTASGEPEIVYKPNVILKVTNIDLYNIKPAFASNQTDAYYQYMDYGLYINTGNYLPSIARPALAIRYPCITGRSYKIEVEYSSLYGNMKLDFINIDGTTNISSTNLQYIETGESYKYTSEITKRIGDGAYFNLYFKNSIANSEMLISKIIIYEYQ